MEPKTFLIKNTVLMDDIRKLVVQQPNDMELGKEIRKMILVFENELKFIFDKK